MTILQAHIGNFKITIIFSKIFETRFYVKTSMLDIYLFVYCWLYFIRELQICEISCIILTFLQANTSVSGFEFQQLERSAWYYSQASDTAETQKPSATRQPFSGNEIPKLIRIFRINCY